MKGVLYIDGIDVYTSYGISLSEVAYDELVCMPDLKPFPYNDWHEKNGIEPDLSEPVVSAMDVTLPFNIANVGKGYKAFIEAITDGAYHTFHFAVISLTKSLRLKSCGALKSTFELGSFTLTFSDDDPMNGYEYVEPSSSLSALGNYFIDGKDIAIYGVRILQGTMDAIRKSPDVKENLKRDISVKDGVIYDGERVTYKSRTTQLQCLMRAQNAEEFWRNRNALFYDLTRPGEHVLTVSELGKDIPCFYKGCSVKCFYPDNGKYWFEFVLSLEIFKGVI